MPSHYELTVKGQPGELLRAAFEDVVVSSAPGVTILSADLDQPALHGLLARIEDLGLELLDMDDWAVGVPEGNDGEQYYFPDDLSDKAIEWIRAVRAQDAQKPWMMYYSTGCAHAPHHGTSDRARVSDQ